MADSYRIVGQRQTTTLSPAGQFEDQMEVTFQSLSGTTGKVNIPLARYTAEYVHDVISDYVQRIDAVEQL